MARRLGVGMVLRMLLPLPAAAGEAPQVQLRQAPPRSAPAPTPTPVLPWFHPDCLPWLPPGLNAGAAMDLAEGHTGGVAVSAREIALNGATGGFEVRIRMPQRERGWRVVVDRDTGTIRGRYPIPNPERSVEPPLPAQPAAPPAPEPDRAASLRAEAPSRPQPVAAAGRRLYRWVDAGGVVWITTAPPAAGGRRLD